MKLVVISDTHGYHRSLSMPVGDVLVHCGDITNAGELSILSDFCTWASELHLYKRIVIVPGNHDFKFDISLNQYDVTARCVVEEHGFDLLIDNVIGLEDPESKKTWKLLGSPWVPNLHGWAFYDKGRDRYKELPTDIDILVTHGPACGVLDRTLNNEPVGSIPLSRYIQRCPKLQVHCHGHIHEARGTTAFDVEPKHPISINAAICNRLYKPDGKPWVVTLGGTSPIVDYYG